MAWDPTVPAENAPLLSAPIRDNFAALDALMTGGGGVTFPLLAPDGTMAAPSYSFTGATGGGFYRSASGRLAFSVGGQNEFAFLSGALLLSAFRYLGWATGYADSTGPDLSLERNAAGILALRGTDTGTGASLNFAVMTAPATPATGQGLLYLKADKHLYQKNDAGLETALVGGTGVTQITALTQAAYDALTPKVATTLYVITP